jgi:ABC-type amino acid transport system permease subunit
MDVTKFLLVMAVIIWVMARGTQQLGYNWQWYQIPKYIFQFQDGEFSFGPLLFGLAVTFRITAWGLVLSMTIGLVTALLRLSNSLGSLPGDIWSLSATPRFWFKSFSFTSFWHLSSASAAFLQVCSR